MFRHSYNTPGLWKTRDSIFQCVELGVKPGVAVDVECEFWRYWMSMDVHVNLINNQHPDCDPIALENTEEEQFEGCISQLKNNIE